MKMSEAVHRPASFLKKEVRRIVFSQIAPNDLPELYNTLYSLYAERRNCELWICIGHRDFWFHNEEKFYKFVYDFSLPLELLDEDFLDHFGKARAGHPQLRPGQQG
jgi:hypothetical protein